MELGKLSNPKYNWVATILGFLVFLLTLTTSLVDYFAVPKHAPIYGIEKFTYYDLQKDEIAKLNNKLSSGKYTLLYFRDLNINEPGFGDMHIVMLGQIEK